MNKTGWVLAIITILIIVAACILFVLPGKSVAPTTDTQATTTPATSLSITAYPASAADDVKDLNIQPGGKITSPFNLTGSASGWYFEASFGVQLKDASGTVIATVPATATSDWMTSAFVPFEAKITFPAQPAGSKGTLILHNDNASGLPENDKSIEIPVTF